MILYDHPASGNCMKARILLRQLELPYERVQVDLFKGETRTPEHFARNPDGRVPVLELDSGETIAESNAILLHLAEGTPLPPDRAARAHARARVDVLRAEPDRGGAGLRALPAPVGSRRADARGVREPPRARQRRPRGARPRALRRPRLRSPAPTTPSPTSPCTPTCTAPTTPAPTSAGTSTSAAGSSAWRRSPAS